MPCRWPKAWATRRTRAGCWVIWGITTSKRGDHAKAIDYYQQAIKITEEINSKYFLCYALHNLAELHYDRERFEETERLNSKALEIAREIQSKEIVLS